MFAPIRPSPIMPICIDGSLSERECSDAAPVRHCAGVSGASSTRRARVSRPAATSVAEMDAERPAAALGEHREVAARLRRLDDAEGVRCPGTARSRGVVAGDLQEHARVRSALVGLAGRVQEARPEAEQVATWARSRIAVPDVLQHAGVCVRSSRRRRAARRSRRAQRARGARAATLRAVPCRRRREALRVLRVGEDARGRRRSRTASPRQRCRRARRRW